MSFGRTLAMVCLIASLSACVWRGYRAPEPATLATTGDYPPCPAVGVQNLRRDHPEIIRAAAAEVCSIFGSAEFRAALEPLSLRETCGSETRINGAELNRLLLTALPPAYSVVARKPFLAEAVTDPVNARMAIRTGRFEAWRRGGPGRGDMINTLAHEMTHLVRSGAGSRFQDDGHNPRADSRCPDASLVSYRIGELAEQVWRQRNGYPAEAENTGRRRRAVSR